MQKDMVMTIDDFIKNKTMLLDGSTGVKLMTKGLESGQCPELWNIERKDDVYDIVYKYYEAGSDAVLTNTFGGNSIKLSEYDLSDKTYSLVFRGVNIAKEAASKFHGKFVIGSIGPTGQFMEPMGDISEKEMIEAFVPCVKAMVDARADMIVLETFTDINELAAAAKAVRENSALPFLGSMTFDKNPLTGKYNTIMGVSVSQAHNDILSLGAIGVGSNCGNGLLNMVEIMKEYREADKNVPLWAKPNAGIPEYKDGKTVYNEDAQFFKENIHKLFEHKISFVGGCCGAVESHIKAIRSIIG